LEVSIEVTNRCSLHCLHCSSRAGIPFANELTLPEIMMIIREAKKINTNIITLSGGEPLLREDIEEIIRFIKKNKMEIRLQTSGCYKFAGDYEAIPNRFLNLFSDLPSKSKIVFSIHGLSETHDKITSAPNSLEITKQSIRLAKKKGIFTEVHTVFNSLNYQEATRIYHILENLKVDSWHVLRLVEQGRCAENPTLMLSIKEFRQLIKSIINLSKRFNYPKIELGHNISRYYWLYEHIDVAGCTLGEDKLLIKADGEIAYCAALKDLKYGNIRENKLHYFWHEHIDIVRYRNFLKNDYKYLKGKCSKCDILHLCKGGCLAQRINTYHDLFRGPDPLCFRKINR